MPRRSASARSGRCGKSGLTLIAVALFHGSISRSHAAGSSAPAKFGMRPCGGNGKRATPSAASRPQTHCRPQYQADCACLRSRPRRLLAGTLATHPFSKDTGVSGERDRWFESVFLHQRVCGADRLAMAERNTQGAKLTRRCERSCLLQTPGGHPERR